MKYSYGPISWELPQPLPLHAIKMIQRHDKVFKTPLRHVSTLWKESKDGMCNKWRGIQYHSQEHGGGGSGCDTSGNQRKLEKNP